jgi:hypothetical protein
MNVAATFSASSAARVLNQNAPHDFRSDRKKVCALFPCDAPVMSESQVALMHQVCRLQRMTGALIAQVMARLAVQLLIDEWHQRVERRLVSVAPIV